jgi:hypothetical protein
MLFTQKRFFRIVGSELFERLLRLVEPIGELEMKLTVMLHLEACTCAHLFCTA